MVYSLVILIQVLIYLLFYVQLYLNVGLEKKNEENVCIDNK